ncbi:hypothetical protein H4R35_001697 [Dimargaris xerosporica]|nr:hypothetical protein H4R35_001697 [Dimargaris xerosporica]
MGTRIDTKPCQPSMSEISPCLIPTIDHQVLPPVPNNSATASDVQSQSSLGEGHDELDMSVLLSSMASSSSSLPDYSEEDKCQEKERKYLSRAKIRSKKAKKTDTRTMLTCQRSQPPRHTPKHHPSPPPCPRVDTFPGEPLAVDTLSVISGEDMMTLSEYSYGYTDNTSNFIPSIAPSSDSDAPMCNSSEYQSPERLCCSSRRNPTPISTPPCLSSPHRFSNPSIDLGPSLDSADELDDADTHVLDN